MKRFVENIILSSFVIFFFGGLLLVFVQTIGLVMGQVTVVVDAKNVFAWIFPLSALTGLMCYLYSYMKKP